MQAYLFFIGLVELVKQHCMVCRKVAYLRHLIGYPVLLMMTMAGGAHADSKPELVWSLYHFPPHLMLDESLPGKGGATEFVRRAVAEMPEFDHKFEKVSFNRTIGLMKDGVFTCNPLLLKVPEREAFIEHSLPIMMAVPHHVVIGVDSANRLEPHLNSQGQVAIESLLGDSTLSTSRAKDRAHPKVISQAYEKITDFSHINQSSTDLSTPVRQLQAGWVDYIIAYPFEIKWYSNSESTGTTRELKYMPIEGMPEYVLGHVGCTKGERGTKVINAINDVIRREGPRPFWHLYQYNYMDSTAQSQLEQMLIKHQPFGSF
ncbi:hypothetical protein [Vibrio sp. SCSIO 43136]|uniref:hypothetical protein n=1 Tax=Vibrio sp. SCSIO 43136 TaxID=2819101 RepID=UPI00207559FE|nr:hypothetical protein [Vibrio sp. SCSIO 43136]USD66989.1 hypothetical protein J4N39_20340 [Vibrio sp. SCSIO 43136]